VLQTLTWGRAARRRSAKGRAANIVKGARCKGVCVARGRCADALKGDAPAAAAEGLQGGVGDGEVVEQARLQRLPAQHTPSHTPRRPVTREVGPVLRLG
jgi:hypothetical protein